MVLAFQSLDKTRKYDHSNQSTTLPGAVCYCFVEKFVFCNFDFRHPCNLRKLYERVKGMFTDVLGIYSVISLMYLHGGFVLKSLFMFTFFYMCFSEDDAAVVYQNASSLEMTGEGYVWLVTQQTISGVARNHLPQGKTELDSNNSLSFNIIQSDFRNVQLILTFAQICCPCTNVMQFDDYCRTMQDNCIICYGLMVFSCNLQHSFSLQGELQKECLLQV